MRFASLGSGSEGNAWLVEVGTGVARTCVMVDCGFTIKETVVRLQRAGLTPGDIAALVVTHEHDDHIGGIFRFARRFGTPVWLTAGTWRVACRNRWVDVDWLEQGRARLFDSHTPWSIGDLELQPFPVPHDAAEPAQFVLSDGKRRLGLMTDCGMPTPHIVHMLSNCDALVLESNHDPSLLNCSMYPPSLKKRISSDYGHLSNDAACEILLHIDRGRLHTLVAAHLSKSTNAPQLVKNSWTAALGGYEGSFLLADQAEGLYWQKIA
ncbi:MAG: MBL fold metallo-hydrolase [Burkholderiaceae bacterium]